MEDRFRKRLASWKSQYISKGGRFTLIQSTLLSLPIYCLSLFRMLVLICTRLEKIQREFLWSGGSREKKPHLVNLKTVCTEKKKGVLDCVDFPFSTKHCCANGVDVSLTKGILFGEGSLVASSEKNLGVGVLATSVVVLGLGCGRKSEKNGPSLSKIPLLPLEMGEGLTFGRMSGVVRRR